MVKIKKKHIGVGTALGITAIIGFLAYKGGYLNHFLRKGGMVPAAAKVNHTRKGVEIHPEISREYNENLKYMVRMF